MWSLDLRAVVCSSVPLARTLAAVLSSTVTVPPSATVALSLLATGGSLTGVTVIETVAVPLHLGSATGGEPVVPLSQVGRAQVWTAVSLPSWLQVSAP